MRLTLTLALSVVLAALADAAQPAPPVGPANPPAVEGPALLEQGAASVGGHRGDRLRLAGRVP